MTYDSFLLHKGTPIQTADVPHFQFMVPTGSNPGVPDIFGLKTANTGTNSLEVHVVDGSQGYQAFKLQTGTRIPQSEVPNYRFAVAAQASASPIFPFPPMPRPQLPDIYCLKITNSASGFLEVQVLSGATNYLSLSPPAPTPISCADAANFDFAVGDVNGDGVLDLFAIKRSNTGTGKIEVHILDGSSQFTSFIVQTGTPLDEAGAANWRFAVGAYSDVQENDLFCFKVSDTASSDPEIHILTAPLFQSYALETPIPISPQDAPNRFVFGVASAGSDVGNVFCMKTGNTRTGTVEVEVLFAGGGTATPDVPPPTVVTPANIPDYSVDDSVNLASYLQSNPHRTAVQILAREVVIDSDVVCRADLSTPPLSLRIECSVLTVHGSRTLDLTGTDAVLGWKSYQPQAGLIGQPGEAGFDGGDFYLCALTVNAASADAHLTVKAGGGQGGLGQNGYPGRDGTPGTGGVDFTTRNEFDPGTGDAWTVVDTPGTPPTDGGPGEDGTTGGTGGDGGAAGRITIYAPTSAKTFFTTLLQPGAGGNGGTGGPCGNGGPPGAPSKINTSSDPDDWHVASANEGPNGNAGSSGLSGVPGLGGAPAITLGGAAQIQGGMSAAAGGAAINLALQQFQARANALFDRATYALMRGTPVADVMKRVQWLTGWSPPNTLIDSRYQQLSAVASSAAAMQDPLAAFASQRLRIPRDAVDAGLTMLGTLGQPQFASDHSRLNSLLSASAATEAMRSSDLGILPGAQAGGDLVSAASSFFGEMAKHIASAPENDDDVEMTQLIDDDACTTADDCTVGADLTADEMLIADGAAMGPEGALVGLAAAVVTYALGQIFGSGLDAADAARRAAFQKARSDWENDLQKYENDETARAGQDAKNDPQFSNESARQRARRRANRRRNDTDMARFIYGTELIGVLDKLELTEDGSQYVGVFDVAILPAISDPLSAAIFMATVTQCLSMMVTASLSKEMGDMLTPGDWYELDLDLTQLTPSPGPGVAKVEPFIYFPNVFSLSPKAQTAWALVGLFPAEVAPTVALRAVTPADSLVVSALTGVMQFMTVKTIASPSPSTLGIVAAPINAATIVNVGQASCCLMWDTNANAARFAFDMGYGAPVGMAVASTYLGNLALAQAPILLSHWDLDHYRLIPSWAGVITVQAYNPVVGPTFGHKGVTLRNLLLAIASYGPGHLFLTGSYIAAFISVKPSVFRTPQLDPILQHPALGIPSNVTVARSTYADQPGGPYHKNDIETLSVRVSGSNGALLIPGDTSFFYVPAAQKANLSQLQATHHASRRSILRQNGQSGGTVADNDIPPTLPGGLVIYSYGAGNSYGHAPQNVAAFYAGRNWTVSQQTPGAAVGVQLVFNGPYAEAEKGGRRLPEPATAFMPVRT